jgi:hypothetical protein
MTLKRTFAPFISPAMSMGVLVLPEPRMTALEIHRITAKAAQQKDAKIAPADGSNLVVGPKRRTTPSAKGQAAK